MLRGKPGSSPFLPRLRPVRWSGRNASEGAGERRLVTAVFVDLVGSTAQGDRRDPEDISARLVPFYGRVREELERFGGTVEKFIGDAVVALFGAPIANEDDPERALRAAFAVRTASPS